MGIIEWATSPLGQSVPIHIAWFLIWVALIAGLLFLVVHAIYLRYFAKEKQFAAEGSAKVASQLPARIPRHSLTARLFHWVMAAAMFTLLFTAFLPKVGVRFDWVTYHWIAGTVLTISIIFHIIHASFYMDFWSIWPDRADLEDAWKRVQRFMGRSSPVFRNARAAAAEVCQVSARKQALSRRHCRDRVVGDCDRRVHDVARAHHLLSTQPIFVQRHDLGLDVCSARIGWRRPHHAGHCPRVLCGPA